MKPVIGQEPISAEQGVIPYALRNEAFSAALLDPDIDIPIGIGKQKNQNSPTGKSVSEAPKRFSVYRNNVVVSLMDAMASNFPSLLAIMGEDNFKRVIRNFILNHPPSLPMMQQYGRELPGFLENFKPLAKSPFLKDVAQAELSWINAFHAKDDAILTAEELQSVDAEKVMELVFEPHPAFHIISSLYPVTDLFEARNLWPKPGLDIANAQTLIITRPYFECFTNNVDKHTETFLSLVAAATPLGEAISITSEKFNGFDATHGISTMLQIGGFRSLNVCQNNQGQQR
jgi:hypothetical protein